MTIRYANNFNKGKTYTDGIGQVWVYTPEFNQPDVSGKRFAYVMDTEASVVAMAEANARAVEFQLAEEERITKEREQLVQLITNVQRRLRKLGFKRTFKSKFGSTYYERNGYRKSIPAVGD